LHAGQFRRFMLANAAIIWEAAYICICTCPIMLVVSRSDVVGIFKVFIIHHHHHHYLTGFRRAACLGSGPFANREGLNLDPREYALSVSAWSLGNSSTGSFVRLIAPSQYITCLGEEHNRINGKGIRNSARAGGGQFSA
jgi:hypothetical protein